MVCKLCPTKKYCWDKGDCENCEFCKVINGLAKKNAKLKEKNKALQKENEELKQKLDIMENCDF